MDTPKSGDVVPLLLDSADLGQALDALDSRARAYEMTAEYLETGKAASASGSSGWDDDAAFFIAEEVDDADEARAIAAHFRAVEATLTEQWEQHRAQRGTD